MTSERLQIVYELCVVLENTDAQLRRPPVSFVVTGRPVFLLAYTISQTLISITLLNSTYSSHPVDCAIIQFKAEDRCLGKQAEN